MKNQKGFTVVELAVAIGAALTLVAVATGVWVLFHFLAKFW